MTAAGWLLTTGLVKPMSMNDRTHRMAEYRMNKAVRSCVATHAAYERISPQSHVHVRLEYTPRVNRRRDTDNLWKTAKPAVDGIVDAGVVPDDTPEFVTRHEPVILPAVRVLTGARLHLRVWVESAEDVT